MAFAPGAGYGVAMVGNAVAPAMVEAHRHEEDEALKQRQMALNEKAEDRAGKFYDAQTKSVTQRTAMERANALTPGMETEVTAGYPKPGTSVPSASQAAAPSTAPAPNPQSTDPTAAVSPQQQVDYAVNGVQPEPRSLMGNPAYMGPDGQWVDSMTGEPTELLEHTVGKGAKGFTPPSSGQRVAMPVKIYGAGAAAPKTAAGKEVAPGGVMSAKDETGVRGGKLAVTPDEGAGYMTQAAKLRESATAVEGRLQEALKAVDERYGNEPQMAEYLKANLQAKIGQKIGMMRGNADEIEHQGKIANFAQQGSQFAEGVLSHLNRGGAIDESWIKQNEKTVKDLGIDPGLLYGMHMDKTGYIRNAKNALIPYDALLRVSNPALPYLERIKGWQDIDNMLVTQTKLQQGWARLKNEDPTQFLRDVVALNAGFTQEYQQKEEERRQAEAIARNGGTLELVIDGKPQKVKVEAIPKDADIISTMSTSKDPNQRAFYDQVIKPIYARRALLGTMAQFTENAAKGSVKTKTYGTQEREEEEKTDEIGNRAYGKKLGELRAEEDFKESKAKKTPAGGAK